MHPVEKMQPRGKMYKVSSLNHMNTKVDALHQKLDNLSSTPIANVAAVTPSCKIYGVPGHITVECQLLVEPSPYQVNYA